jgi:tRNA (guanosine-2'-O-)-methyltransferase
MAILKFVAFHFTSQPKHNSLVLFEHNEATQVSVTFRLKDDIIMTHFRQVTGTIHCSSMQRNSSLLFRCLCAWTMCGTSRSYLIFPRSVRQLPYTTWTVRSKTTTFAGSRKRWKHDTSTSSTNLEWERFEYSKTPKWDARFNDTRSVIASNQEELDEIIALETKEDQLMSERFESVAEAMRRLSPKWVEDATKALTPYIQTERLARIDEVFSKRTQHCRFLFENPANPSNVWACLRTMDSFGIQYVDLVIESGRYTGKAALAQKRGMRTAMGSAQWLTLRNHQSTTEAIRKLRDEQGYKIYASDLNPNSRDIRDIRWNDDPRPICIVMGNENDGISDTMRELADETFMLPMCGFAESFNLSVATAIALAHLSAKSIDGLTGPLRPGDLEEHDLNCLRFRGILNSLAQKKASKAILRREGIELPPELEWIF